jgi:CysZ protein
MLDDMLAAANQIVTPPFRKVMLKTLLMTFVLLGLVFVFVGSGFERLLSTSVMLPYAWLAATITILGGVGLFFGLAFLVVPISFVVGGFFFDELADAVERDLSPHGPHGRAMPASAALLVSLRFAALSLVVNLVALVLWLVPGLNAVALLVANAYLLGRGTFELAALRFVPLAEVHHLRALHSLRLFVAGLVMAGFSAVPVLNLLSPLFFTAFMVRVTHGILSRRPTEPLRRGVTSQS